MTSSVSPRLSPLTRRVGSGSSVVVSSVVGDERHVNDRVRVQTTSARKGGRKAWRTVTASSSVHHVLVGDNEPFSNNPPRADAVRRLDVQHGAHNLLVQRGFASGPIFSGRR